MDKLPYHIDIPEKYWPNGVSHQGFYPSWLRANAERTNNSISNFDKRIEVYAGILMFLIDNVDWEKINSDNEETTILWPSRSDSSD